MTRLQGKYSRMEERHEPVAYKVHYQEYSVCTKIFLKIHKKLICVFIYIFFLLHFFFK